MIGLLRGEESSTGGGSIAKTVADQGEETAKALTRMIGTANEIAEEGKEIPNEPTLFEKIGGFFTSLLTSLSNFITSVEGNSNATQLLDKVTKLFDIVYKIFEVVSKVIGATIDWIHRIATDDYAFKYSDGTPITGVDGEVIRNNSQKIVDYIVLAFGAIGLIITKIAQGEKLSKLATIAGANDSLSSLGMQILEISGAIMIIAYAIEKLGSIPTDQLAKGGAAVAVVGVLVGIIIKLVAGLRESGIDQEPETALERILSKFISIAGMAGMLWIIMDKLPGIIEALASAKKTGEVNGDDVFKTLLGVMTAVSGAMLALAVVNKLLPNGMNFVGTLKTVATVLIALGAAALGLYTIGEIFDGLGGNPDNIKKMMANVSAFMEGLGDMVNSLIRGLFGTTHAEQLQAEQADKNIENTGKVLDLLATMKDRIDLTEIADLSLLMETVTNMTQMAENVDTTKLLGFSQVMEDLSTGLLNISKVFVGTYQLVTDEFGHSKFENVPALIERGSEQWENLEAGINLYSKLFEAMVPVGKLPASGAVLGQYRDWFKATFLEDNGAVDFINGMNKIIDAAGGLKDGSGISFDGIAIVSQFYTAIQDAFNVANDNPDAFPKFNAMPIINSILDALLVGEVTIKEAVKNLVQQGINLLGQESKANPATYDLSGILGGMDLSSLLSIFNSEQMTELENQVLEQTGQFDSMVDQALQKGNEALENKYGENGTEVTGLGIKVSGLVLDENFMTNLEAQMTELQTVLDTNEDYTLKLRPVFQTEGLGNEVTALSDFINGSIPIKFDTATIDLSNKPLFIDDSGILSSMASLRAELAMTRNAVRSAIEAASVNLGSRISGLGGSFRGMSVVIDKDVLVGSITDDIDAALGAVVGEVVDNG